MTEFRARLVHDLARDLGVDCLPGSRDNQLLIAVSADKLPDLLAALIGLPGRLLGLWGTAEPGGPVAHYAIETIDADVVVIVRVLVDTSRPHLPSIAAQLPAAAWAEREIHDQFGVEFDGHPDPRLIAPPPGQPFPAEHTSPTAIVGAGTRHLSLGPRRGPLDETLALELDLLGDRVLLLDPRLGYKHRDAERRVEGRSAAHAVAVAERLCGNCALSNATGFVLALESLTDTTLPARAIWLRTALLEVERIVSHALALTQLLAAAGWTAGAVRAQLARERLLTAVEAGIGTRSLRGVITVGGMRRDLVQGSPLEAATHEAAGALRDIGYDAIEIPAVLDQLEGAAIVTPAVAHDYEAVGPAARAAGIRRDARVDHPYLGYGELSVWAPVYWTGDALARLRIWMDEIEQSATLIEELLTHLPAGPIRTESAPLAPRALGVGVIEAPAGTTLHVVHTDGAGRIARWFVRSASAATWPVVPLALFGRAAEELTVVEKSFGLCVACADR